MQISAPADLLGWPDREARALHAPICEFESHAEYFQSMLSIGSMGASDASGPSSNLGTLTERSVAQPGRVTA